MSTEPATHPHGVFSLLFLLGVLRRDVDVFGQLRQRLVGRPFFVERLLKQSGMIRMAQEPRPSSDSAIPRHLLMLHVLRGGDQPGVQHIGFRAFLDQL